MALQETDIKDLSINNPCQLIGNGWMLISSGNKVEYNTMTASWGHIGALWGHGLMGRPTVEIFVRPTRYTDELINKNDYFTLCFFDEKYKDDLLYLGTHSGKNENKIKNTKLNVSFIDDLPIFKEAKLIIIAKKIYKAKIEEKYFIDKNIIKDFYNNDALHNVYIGEIVKVLLKK